MTRTIWLASYPKSGNTWVRILLANVRAAQDGPADINDLMESRAIASARPPFDHLTMLDSTLLTHDEIDDLRPRVYEALADGAKDGDASKADEVFAVRFPKVHDAYGANRKGEPILAGARGADGAILIVRDPRDVAPSLANHNRCSIDEAIRFMNDDAAVYYTSPDKCRIQFRQKLSGWSNHAASWLDQADIPVHVIRYEDLRAVTAEVFAEALLFAGCPAADADIKRAVSLADFTQLKAQEREKGFREAPLHLLKTGGFFRRGEAGAWRDSLTAEQVTKLETVHGAMMQRLGYALSTDPEGDAQ